MRATPPAVTQVELVYFNAGGGHRAAAQALQAVLAERRPDWQVRPVDLFRILDPQARLKRLTGLAPEDVYNKRLARGLTRTSKRTTPETSSTAIMASSGT